MKEFVERYRRIAAWVCSIYFGCCVSMSSQCPYVIVLTKTIVIPMNLMHVDQIAFLLQIVISVHPVHVSFIHISTSFDKFDGNKFVCVFFFGWRTLGADRLCPLIPNVLQFIGVKSAFTAACPLPMHVYSSSYSPYLLRDGDWNGIWAHFSGPAAKWMLATNKSLYRKG